jgi:shikimate kinase
VCHTGKRGLIGIKLQAAGKNIILTGFMGTGKTAVGEILAYALDRHFVDTDRLVEERAGCTIAELFSKYGEAYFRDRESEAILSLTDFQPGTLVVATGGGAVLREHNRSALSREGLIVLLTATPLAIKRRTAKNNSRPLLAENSTAKISAMLQEREIVYNACTFSIDTTGLTARQVAGKILTCINSPRSDKL